MNVLEFVGSVSVSLDSSGITLKSAEKEVSLPLPVNLVSFYVAGGYAYWDLPGELLHLVEDGASCFTGAIRSSTGISSGRSDPTTLKAGETIQ